METALFIIAILIIPFFMIPKRLNKKEAEALGYEGENCKVCGCFNTYEENDINGGVCYNCHSPLFK